MSTQLDAVREIKAASEEGREIICLIGAGLSAESGIPPLAKLTKYLAKVQSYITHAAFRPPTSDDGLSRFGEGYPSEPSSYLRDFGWPNLNQLNADLWGWIDQRFKGQRSSKDYRSYLDYLVRSELIEDLLRFDPALEGALGEQVKQVRTARLGGRHDEAERLFATRKWIKESKRSGLWHASGNWRNLLSHLTHSDPDYADTLFQSLTRNRVPGMAQRFLAFLAPILGLRLFLTVNFDDLLEEALRYEGLHPVVYAVSRDSPPPHPSLIRNRLSVVKLHGDAFRLRLGENLDHPLDEETKARLREYLPDRPLLLVLGVGGGDRRIMDFVDLVAKEHKKGDSATVYWFHFESSVPESVEVARRKNTPDAIQAVRTPSPAALLLELYSRLTGTHPPSFQPYDPKMPRPIEAAQAGQVDQGHCEEMPIVAFQDGADECAFGASRELARFVAAKSGAHIPIWIDLEDMYSYEDVVVEIVRQIRRHDRSVPPIALVGDSVEKAVGRLCTALIRDRYLLAFNGVSSFGRPSTRHDSRLPEPKSKIEKGHQKRRKDFLLKLIRMVAPQERFLRDSILAFSLREGIDPELRRELEPYICEAGTHFAQVIAGDQEHEDREPLTLLAAFRRRRSYVALLQLLPNYLHDSSQDLTRQERVDAFLEKVEPRYLLRVLGGEFWMCRRIRNTEYSKVKAGTSSKELLEALRKPVLSTLDDLTLLAQVHADIANYCYSDLFAASGEPSALLEHLYHLISSLRYLTKLDAWLLLSCKGVLPEEIGFALNNSLKRDLRLKEYESGERTEIDAAPDVCLRFLRLKRLRALRRVFRREREVLLSLVPPDTLIGWIDDLLDDDIRRFHIRHCLATGNNSEALTALQELVASARQPLKEREEQIEIQCDELHSQLQDLKADVLRGKMDFLGCREVRLDQIRKLFGVKTVPKEEAKPFLEKLNALWARRIGPWLEKNKRFQTEESRRMRSLMRYLYDIVLCFRDQGDHAQEHIQKLVNEVMERARHEFGTNSGEEGEDLEAMKVRWLRSAVDPELMGISPWTLRNGSAGDLDRIPESCTETVKVCDEALRTLSWATGETYARYRSYFQSLKGRAYYIRAFVRGRAGSAKAERTDLFDGAHRNLGRARAGLPRQTGANREALAISLLRLAECLMVQANMDLDDLELPTLDSESNTGDAQDRALGSARRRLDRARDVLEQAEEMLIGARQNLEWWACLYQLRAQMQVEELLYLLALPVKKSNTDVNSPAECPDQSEDKLGTADSNVPHGLPPQTLQTGLNAIRQGLDVLLPIRRKDEGGRRNFRIERFLCIWIELMICGAALASTPREPDATETSSLQEAMSALSKRWVSLNDTSGLKMLVGRSVLADFSDLQEKLPRALGVAARSKVLEIIKSGVQKKHLQKLWKKLQSS